MIYILRVFGIKVITFEKYELVLEEEPGAVTGGSTHDFERDLCPLDPFGEEPCEWEFGFQRGVGDV